jgi:uncharacterized protein (DUF1330 family)
LGEYQKEYVPLAQASIRASGGRLVAAAQNVVGLEGSPPATRVAINRFDSTDAAQAWRNSDQYKEARKVGDKYAKFRAFVVEGLPEFPLRRDQAYEGSAAPRTSRVYASVT